jgi:uncharacterized RDD family membrane protein YckC
MNRYQTLGKRIIALLVDFLVFLPLIAVFVWLPESGVSPAAYLAITIAGSLSLSYNILLHWKYGQTLGKMVAKARVVDASTEEAISFKQAFLRDVFYFVTELLDFLILLTMIGAGSGFVTETIIASESYVIYLIYVWLPIDILVCLKSKKNRALHDLIAGTVVVRLDVPAAEVGKKKLEPPGPESYAGLGANAGESSRK